MLSGSVVKGRSRPEAVFREDRRKCEVSLAKLVRPGYATGFAPEILGTRNRSGGGASLAVSGQGTKESREIGRVSPARP